MLLKKRSQDTKCFTPAVNTESIAQNEYLSYHIPHPQVLVNYFKIELLKKTENRAIIMKHGINAIPFFSIVQHTLKNSQDPINW